MKTPVNNSMKTTQKTEGETAATQPERQDPRYPHLRELSVAYEGRSETITVHPPDISQRGMFINMTAWFPEGSVLKLRFRLPHSGVEITTRAEVRYCLAGVGIGVKFLDLPASGSQAIEEEILLGDHKQIG
jgi:PilZ domain